MRQTLLILLCCLSTVSVHAEDVVRLFRQGLRTSQPVHAQLVLEEALRHTQKKYGPYRFEVVFDQLVRERLLIEMIKGQEFNVASVASQPEWESRMLPIWIPADMGLSGLRIGFIRKDSQARLSQVKTVEDLRQLSIGMGSGWSSRKVFELDGFSLEVAANQDQLAQMLVAGRFDYFPRGVGEIFPEFDAKTDQMPTLAIESDLLLSIPLPTYFFVSPAAPRIARRIRDGMEAMVKDGTLLRMVTSYHADILQRAKLCSRRIIALENPLLSSETPLQRKEIWFDPFAPKVGYCNTQAAGSQTGRPSARKSTRAASAP